MAAGPKRQSGWKTARHSDSLFSRLYSRFETKISYLGAFAVGAARRGSTGPDDIRVGVIFSTPPVQERAQFRRQFLGHPAFHSKLPVNRRHHLST